MISEAFLLRELGALRIPVNDIIEFSEVITSEKLGPVDLKYRGYTEHIHESARFIYDLLVQGINENKSVGRENDKKQVLDNILDIILQSHLIRSPLNRIIGFSEVIMRELFGPIDSRYRTCVEEMYARGMLLLGVINDLLDLARLETVGIELDEGSIDVEKAVQEVLRGAVLQASQRQVGLTWVPSAAKLPDLFCDRSRLRQMLLNILLSAAQFDKPGRMVEVGTELSDGLAIVIRDNGWGVLIDALKLILTKSLIERHGGNLSMVSTLNDGVTLRLSFPPERIIRGGW